MLENGVLPWFRPDAELGPGLIRPIPAHLPPSPVTAPVPAVPRHGSPTASPGITPPLARRTAPLADHASNNPAPAAAPP